MIYLIIIDAFLILVLIALLIMGFLYEKVLWIQKLYCFLFDNTSYKEYTAVKDYNKIFNRTIPVYEDYVKYDSDTMEDRYYIMNGGLWFGDKCLYMKYLKLMMQDLIERNTNQETMIYSA